MTFGTKLQNLRKSNNMSQEALAEILNVSRQAVSKWETDQSLPDTANIIAISEIFSQSIDYLLLDKEPDLSIKKSSKDKTNFILAIISSSIGFLGNAVIYIFSRFIKVYVPVARVRVENSPWRVVKDLKHSFFHFISEYDLWLLFVFFTLLFILGISIFAYKYCTQIKSFISKTISKLKSLKKNKS